MPLPGWATHTITRVRPSTITERGTSKRNYDAPASLLPITGCLLLPETSTINLDGQIAVLHAWKLYAPAGTDIDPFDVILDGLVTVGQYPTFTGTRLMPDGEPQHWSSPTGALDHLEVMLRRWEREA